MDKYKIISIIEGIIIIVLVALLVLNKPSTTSQTIKDNQDASDKSKENKDYIGIYHTNNYGYFNGSTYTEVNITFNSDSTCDLSLYKADIYACNYEEISKDKLNLIISSYIAVNNDYKDNKSGIDNNNFVLGWKLGNTKQLCESRLKERKEQSPNAYTEYTECKKVEEKHEITLLNNGLLYENKQFTKIK